jgi:phytol kinase
VWALIASYLYVGAMVGLGEAIRRRAGWPTAFTRKVVHVGVGLWIIPTLLLFSSWTWAIVPPLTSVVTNVVSYRFSLVPSIEEEGTGNLGTILFPVAFILLIVVFWPLGRPDVVAGGILVLALGDAAAAVIGRRFGRRSYRVGSSTRTLEGSMAMAGFSFLGLVIATQVFPSPVGMGALVMVALLATALEAVSVRGFDNLLVPGGTAAALYLLGR